MNAEKSAIIARLTDLRKRIKEEGDGYLPLVEMEMRLARRLDELEAQGFKVHGMEGAALAVLTASQLQELHCAVRGEMDRRGIAY